MHGSGATRQGQTGAISGERDCEVNAAVHWNPSASPASSASSASPASPAPSPATNPLWTNFGLDGNGADSSSGSSSSGIGSSSSGISGAQVGAAPIGISGVLAESMPDDVGDVMTVGGQATNEGFNGLNDASPLPSLPHGHGMIAPVTVGVSFLLSLLVMAVCVRRRRPLGNTLESEE